MPHTPFPFSMTISPATLVPWFSLIPSMVTGKASGSLLSMSNWSPATFEVCVCVCVHESDISSGSPMEQTSLYNDQEVFE